jgi:hypothetical protein
VNSEASRRVSINSLFGQSPLATTSTISAITRGLYSTLQAVRSNSYIAAPIKGAV